MQAHGAPGGAAPSGDKLRGRARCAAARRRSSLAPGLRCLAELLQAAAAAATLASLSCMPGGMLAAAAHYRLARRGSSNASLARSAENRTSAAAARITSAPALRAYLPVASRRVAWRRGGGIRLMAARRASSLAGGGRRHIGSSVYHAAAWHGAGVWVRISGGGGRG